MLRLEKVYAVKTMQGAWRVFRARAARSEGFQDSAGEGTGPLTVKASVY